MKICWDNLEDVKLNKKGDFRVGNDLYIEMESCKVCGESYLGRKGLNPSVFCGHSCAMSGKNNPMYGIRMVGSLNGMYGSIPTIENREQLAKLGRDTKGPLSPSWKGGVYKDGLTTYDTHKDILGIYEDIRKQDGTEILEARCVYCGNWYTPTYVEVGGRLAAINDLNKGECRLYCSENCKQACPTYGQRVYPKGLKHTTSREVSPYLRKMVLERDSWTCQICGKTGAECQLHCHHMDPVAQNPMFQNDMDSCITLCKGCHKMVHSRKGCRYIDLVCKKVG
jgi:hypothetical protein